MGYLIVVPIAAAIAVYYNRKIDETLPVAILGTSLVAYLCGIVGDLKCVFFVVLSISLFSVLYVVCNFVKQRRNNHFISVGIVIYLLLGIFYFFVTKNMLVQAQDDLHVFGRYVADFCNVGDINRYNYAPGLMMWEYVIEIFGRSFSEGKLFFAVIMLHTALMIAIFANDRTFSIKKTVFLILTIVVVPILNNRSQGFITLQGDFIIGVISAYSLSSFNKLLFTKEKYYKMAVCISLAFLTLTKNTGMVLAFLIIFMILGMEIKEGIPSFRCFISLFSIKCAIVVVASQLSWSVFCRLNKSVEKFGNVYRYILGGKAFLVILPISIVVMLIMIQIIKQKNLAAYLGCIATFGGAIYAFAVVILNNDIRINTIINYIKVIFATYAPDRYFGFGYRFLIPYIMVFIICIFLWEVIFLNIKEELSDDNDLILLLNDCFIIYSSIVFFVNAYGRPASQAGRAKECERYLYSYIVFIVVYYLYLYFKLSVYNVKLIELILSFVLASLILSSNIVGFTSANKYNGPENIFGALNEIEIQEDDVFYYVDQLSLQQFSRFYYCISPADMKNFDDRRDLKTNDMFEESDDQMRYITIEEWKKQLNDCTYVYVASVDDSFEQRYGSLFEGTINNGRLYKVLIQDEDIRLVEIAE